ncbi:MAG: hypothetical protein ACYCVV_09960 [Acidimicrobiales bacterium]
MRAFAYLTATVLIAIVIGYGMLSWDFGRRLGSRYPLVASSPAIPTARGVRDVVHAANPGAVGGSAPKWAQVLSCRCR